jgi:RimJ/RimL family protein N-acetyltransferase
MKSIVTTPRLVLREFALEDAPALYELNSDPEVVKYTGDAPFASVKEAEDFVRGYDHYQEFGYGRWSVILRETGEFIGWCGLSFNELRQVDIGFRFFRKDWGKGYATESARAALTYGFKELGLVEIVGRAAKANTASIRVLEKLGMVYWKDDTCKGIEDSLYYRVRRPE